MGFGADHGGAGAYGPLIVGDGDSDPIVVDAPLTDDLSKFRPFSPTESCGDPQCRQFDHRCPGCGNDLHGDNFCMVSACEQEDV